LEIAGYHPWVNLTYYVLAIGITMVALAPWFLAVTLSLAWIYRKTARMPLLLNSSESRG
jgi:hypothetical protein